jgi:hypothetical protein
MFCLFVCGLAMVAHGQAVATTTVQGTVYLANGQAGGGTLTVSWPSFTTAAGQLVAADQTSVAIGSDGFVSINLAPNLGSSPAGQYYTAVFYLSDGTVNTQYWIVPAAAQATLAQIQAQVMPAAQAVQAVSKAYVDQAITEATQSLLGGAGGVLTAPLYLSGDPTQPLQAADKHYVDTQVATAVPLTGGNMVGPLTVPAVNGVESPAVNSQQTTLQAAMNAALGNGAMEIPPTYAGTDTFTNPNGIRVTDLRASVAQQVERSVKEFGAVCDGVTDDTNALQSAINYAQAHGVALTIPEGTCKTQTLNWHGESIGGLGKQVSALMGFPGQDVLATTPDSPNISSYTRLHDLTIYVDQSRDVSCSLAEGRAAAGSCQVSRPMESNTIFSPGGNGLNGTAGSGIGWAVGNCAIAMQAATGAGGNGLKNAQIENLEIVATGTDPMATQYSGAHSTHTCGLYLAQWPQWSEFKNIDIRGLNTGVAIPALPAAIPAGLLADSNRWQNITIQATHGFTAAYGCNGTLDNVTAMAGNSAATGEPPTGIVLDLPSSQEGWTVRNAVVIPNWIALQPALTVTATGGAVTGVAIGSEHGLGWDPYGTTAPVAFSGSCTAQANATVSTNGSIGAINVTQGGSGCSSTTTASVNAPGNWDTAAPLNLIGGQNMTFFAGSLLRGHGGYTVWNAIGAQSYGTQVNGGGGSLPGGGSYRAFIANDSVGSTFQVDQFAGVDLGAKIQACVNAVNASFGGICDARDFTGSQAMSATLTISTPNTTILLPCATITTSNQVIVTAGTRNVSLRGCAMRGGSAASGSQGGTAFAFSGTGAMIQVGDPSYALDTPGFHIDNAVINTTGATSATAKGLVAYRTQELDVEEMYFLGNSNQTGMTLDGTGNYAGGTIRSVQFDGFQIAVNAIGHQVANPATTDWMNASTFVRLHIDCPTSSGSPIAGTVGINLLQGDGNTFTGGDVEDCATAVHLGLNAQNNTFIGLRNEGSTSQVVADAGSSYNDWITGGTMFTGQLTDNGTRNSFQDTFHRSFNGINGDWYGSQQDATVTNHFRLGIGAGNERGLLNEYQTDYGYRWTEGLSDAAGGEQFYQIQDQLNNVYRLSIGQYNHGQSSTNNQTAMNSAGTGAVVLNSTSNSGTGGVIFGSGGASPGTVATIDNSGDAQFNGTLLVGGTSQSTGTLTVRNNADAEVDYYLWPGLTTSQKGSFTYKDWNGNSQWYMVKDSSNNWAVNSALGGLDSFKAYQSTNSGDTYIDASNSTGHIRLNYETGSGAETDIYSGSSSNLVASFLGPTAIKFPGLAATSGHFCLQADTSGYITNTGVACGTGSGGSGSGTVSSGNSGQIAYYTSSGTTVGGISAVPVASGGTGATTAPAAMANLLPGVAADGSQGVIVTGNVAANSISAASTTTAALTVRNNADAEVDYYLWPGLTTSQRGSFTYKDWNGNSQWYMVKDSSNNWAVNSAIGGLDSFKAYQSTNSGDTYIDASNSTGHIRLNYETGSGAETDIYSGSSSNLVASFLGPTSIKFPGLAAASGHYCLQVDTSGYLTNTGSACGSGGTGSGTVSSGNTGQIAYYTTTGTVVGGLSSVPVTAGGTGSTTAAGALASLGGASLAGANFTGPIRSPNISGIHQVDGVNTWNNTYGSGSTITLAYADACINGGTVEIAENYGGSEAIPSSCASLSIGSPAQPYPQVVDGRLTQTAYKGKLDMLSFGMDGTGATNTTTQFVNAWAAANTISNGAQHAHTLYFPIGQYQINEANLATAGASLLEGESMQGSILNYDGAGGYGTYLYQNQGSNYGGARHIRMNGSNYGGTVTTMAQDFIHLGPNNVDAGVELEDLDFQGAFGNALTFGGGPNFFMRHFRMDAIGGYGWYVNPSTNGGNGDPYHISDGTLSNEIVSGVSNYGIGQGYIQGTGSLSSVTYSSGGTLTGTGSVTLSGFNNSCTGATATMAVNNNAAGAITVTNGGSGCTVDPISATCTSGTASCSGTVALTSTLTSGTVNGYTYGTVFSHNNSGFLWNLENIRDEEDIGHINIGNGDEGTFWSDNDTTSSGSGPTVTFHNYAVAGTTAASHPVVSTAAGGTPVTLIGANNFSNVSAVYKNRLTQQEYGSPWDGSAALYSFGRQAYSMQGIELEDQRFDVIPHANWTGDNVLREIGDWFFRHQTDFSPGTMGPFDVVVSPTSGRASMETAESATSAGTLLSNSTYTPSYLASVTGISGVTVTGAVGSTVVLTGFNGGVTGAQVLVTLATASSFSGASFTVQNQGDGATSAPISATCSNGTLIGFIATCSGTATITSTITTQSASTYANLTAATSTFPAYIGSGVGSVKSGDNLLICSSGGSITQSTCTSATAVRVACVNMTASEQNCAGLSGKGVVIYPAPGCLPSSCAASGSVAANFVQATTSNFGLESNRAATLPVAGSACPYEGDFEWALNPVAGTAMNVTCNSALQWVTGPTYGASESGSGTVTASPQYDLAYYSASGSASSLTGIACGAGTLLQGSATNPTCTATPTIGVAGTTLGAFTLASSGSGGSNTLTPGSITSAYTTTFPPNSGTPAETNYAQTFSAEQIFSNSPGTGSGAYGTLFSGSPESSSLYNPLVYVSPSGATNPTFATNGTMLHINCGASGFTGDCINVTAPNGGSSLFSVNYQGVGSFASNLTAVGGLSVGSNTLSANQNFFVAGGNTLASQTASQLQFGGSSTNYIRVSAGSNNTATVGVNDNYSDFIVGATQVSTAASGTHPWLVSAAVNPLGTVTPGGATVTNTAALYVGPPSAAGTYNDSIFAAGTISDGDGTYGSKETHSPSACTASYGTTSVNAGSATTTTGLNCLPANSVIDAVVYRVTTSITTAASFTVGQTGSASQFCSTQSILTLGATGVCIPSAYAVQSSAAAVAVTFNTTPGAGALRLIVYYHTFVPPTS